MGKLKRGCTMLLGLILAVSLFAAAGCQALHDYAQEMRYKRAKEPIFLFKNDSVYVISGSKVLELKDAGVMDYDGDWYLEGMLSEDNRHLYYMSDVDEDYCGKLQMVEVQLLSAPVIIADDVHSARLSNDGSTLLYVADVDEYTGKLYRRNTDGESTLVAESVYTDCYGASYNGEEIYYIAKKEQGYMDTYVLYMQSGQQDAVALAEVNSLYPDNIIAHATIDGDGTVLYGLGNFVSDIYLKKPGKEAEAIDKGRIEETVNGAEEFFYTKEGELYYKAPGCDPVKAGKWDDSFYIQPYYGMNPSHVYESRFLLDVPEKGAHALTELLHDGTKNVITEGNLTDFKINAGFTCLAYEQEEALYTVHKKDGQWGTPHKQCDYPKYYFFNDAGDKMYYIALDESGGEYGDAYRVSARSGKATLLQENVYTIRLFDDIPHTLTQSCRGYRIDKRPVQLGSPAMGDCCWLDETEGGYIFMFYRLSGQEYERDIYFTEDGKEHELLLEDVGDFVNVWGTSELF